jgi:ligand-binding sensor domain-containing protein
VPNAVPEITGLAEDENGVLLINLTGGLSQLVNGRVEPYPLLAGRTFSSGKLLRDRNGGVWIATHGQGLLHVHKGRADVFTQSDGLSGEWVTNLLEDREGDIWVATLDGLDRFRDFAVPTISVKQGLSNALVVSVLSARDDSVLLGTPSGAAAKLGIPGFTLESKIKSLKIASNLYISQLPTIRKLRWVLSIPIRDSYFHEHPRNS